MRESQGKKAYKINVIIHQGAMECKEIKEIKSSL